MKFKEFVDVIVEANERHAAMAFGRLQPPTTGHAKLVDKVKSVAARYKASHHVVLSHSNDAKSNLIKFTPYIFAPGEKITSSWQHTFAYDCRWR